MRIFWIVVITYCMCWLVSVALFEIMRLEKHWAFVDDIAVDKPMYEDFESMAVTFFFWWGFWLVLFFTDFIPWVCKKLVILFTAIIYTLFKRGDKDER